MPRPRDYDDRVSTRLRLPRPLHARAKARADENDISLNRLLERALERYLGPETPRERRQRQEWEEWRK